MSVLCASLVWALSAVPRETSHHETNLSHTPEQNETTQELAATKHRLAATGTELNQAREELASTKAVLRAVTETTGQSIAQLTNDLVCVRVACNTVSGGQCFCATN